MCFFKLYYIIIFYLILIILYYKYTLLNFLLNNFFFLFFISFNFTKFFVKNSKATKKSVITQEPVIKEKKQGPKTADQTAGNQKSSGESKSASFVDIELVRSVACHHCQIDV